MNANLLQLSTINSVDDHPPGKDQGLKSGFRWESLKYPASLAGVFIAYAAVGAIGLAIPAPPASVVPFWPAAAVSLAALLLFGFDVWPAIFTADLAVSLAHHEQFLWALGAALANTVEPLVGAALLRWAGEFKASLQRLRDVIALVALGAFAGPIAGTAAYVAFQLVVLHPPVEHDFHTWFMWMRGDIVSILVLLPVLLVWSRPAVKSSRIRDLGEVALALLLLVAVNRLIFRISGASSVHDYAIEHLSFLFIIWIALRSGTRGTTVGVLATAVIAVWYTLHGAGPFAPQGLLALHTFLGVISVTGLIIAATISEHRQTEDDLRGSREQLRESEERYRDLFENAQDFVVTLDLKGRFTSVNNAVANASCFTKEELLCKTIFDVVDPASFKAAKTAFQEVLGGKQAAGVQLEVVRKDGAPLWIEVNSRRVEQHGVPVGIQSIGRDISWRRRLEQELLHSQKMEAVGRLAGGVAHDFNNLLAVIIGYSDLLLEEVGADDSLRRRAAEIKKAGKRAAEVTRQLLAFSRKQVLSPKIVDLNSMVSETTKMLLRLLGEDIELLPRLSQISPQVKVDPAQMQQVIMNLAINARDAMPNGGKMILETARVRLDETVHQGTTVVPGDYAVLIVTDTGMGMDETTRSRIFEPFFTTKEEQGTGLGLATVYGFVKQSGGYIWAYSEIGHGTTFKIYLPESTDRLESPEHEEQQMQLPGGSETVLLVEDEESLRELNHELLEALGYTVIEAAHGAAALDKAEQYGEAIHLLLTDVVMPGMSGRELAERLALRRPKMKVLYLSGYTDHVIVQHGMLKPGIAFLQKPFTRETLAKKLREVLESPDPSAAGPA